MFECFFFLQDLNLNPFMGCEASPWRWRQHNPLKCYLTTTLHGITTQKTSAWIFITVKPQVSHKFWFV